jgi:hypothetical protein
MIDVGGEMMPLVEVEKSPGLKENVEIWEEVKGVHFENTERLTYITDNVAKLLSKYQGYLYLSWLTMLSNSAAESLSRHIGGLWLGGLTSLSDPAAESLSKCREILGLKWEIQNQIIKFKK